MLQKKICLLGAYGVGKTSLTNRFVYSRFSEKYHSTLGVVVERKVVEVAGREITLMVWDIAGEDDRFVIPVRYVEGASGYLLVMDGTRPETFERALDIGRRVTQALGSMPALLLGNKCDLVEKGEWCEEMKRISPYPVLQTSAKTGEGVEEAFRRLAELFL